MDMTEMTLAERRKKMREENAKRFAGLSAYMAQCHKESLELIRRRHAYYTKLITDAKIKTAQDFYDRFKEQFLMYGIKLELSDNKKWCSIYLELGDYDYENYHVGDGKDDGLAEVDPEVSFKDMFNNVEVNIFTGEEL
ncbi:MAG: hypothetical protein K2H17_09530 [Duncaniella sp.]|uniref:hypothetical protein n=1 Tax=Duncaniella sp. TaxID=2518496 RepID=UPI0023C2793B|nr:hypothetical protein [Duncaniella sp.]MDE5989626.1 hypothetical protein [Duncaniella sp.]